MTTVIVPFAGADGKTRLDAPRSVRRELSLAMLGDVVAAASVVGHVLIATSDDVAAELGHTVADPGGGQGDAVAAALVTVAGGPVIVLNADLPCVVPEDLRTLLDAIPSGGLALVEALDGTTNALALSEPGIFRPLYGRDSARRFRALPVQSVSVDVPNLADDVDTMADLERLQLRCGPRTQSVFAGTTT